MELFEQIRRDARAGSSVRSLARKYRVHRRVVRQALARRRGLQPDVVLLGAGAAVSLYMAADQGGRAIKRAKRAF